jgi:predicted  nucleic acid-binding Zn-ribbon protein
MEILNTNSSEETWKEEKRKLRNEIASLKKEMNEYKKERKSEWKRYKNNFRDAMDKIEKTLENLTAFQKKKKTE